jgi:hypothetical protein
MTIATTTKSLTVLELLGLKEGQQAIVTTDNDLYGTTVVKHNNTLLNVRTREPLALTSNLLNTKFKLILPEARVQLAAFLLAYKAGRKVKVEIGNRSRILQKEDDLPEELKELFKTGPLAVFANSEVMTMKELTEGSFYVLN